MNRMIRAILILGLFFPCFLLSQNADFLDKWDRTEAYMMKIVESMPDSLYDYKPTEVQMTFAEQVEHIAGNITSLTSNYLIDEKEPKFGNHLPESVSKARRARAYLRGAFQYSKTAIKTLDEGQLDELVPDFFAGPKSNRQILYLLIDHQAHHCGQLIAYLRLNGIKPPRYVGW